MTPFTARRPTLRLPPAPRASRWRDVETANRFTTEALRVNEARVRAALSRSEPFVEVRSTAPADAGTLFVRTGPELAEVEVSTTVVRMDLSGPSPVVLASYPEALETFDDTWELLQLLTRCGPGAAEHWDDPRTAVDAGLAGDPQRASVALSQWRALVGDSPDGTTVQDLVRRVDGSAETPPEGVSWSGWALWFGEHLRDVAAGRTAVTGAPTGATTPSRTAEFDDVDVDRLVAIALAAEEVGPVTRRSVRRTEVGTPLGTVTTTGPELTVAASAVAVVVQDDADGRQVLDAHPELPRPVGLVERYPVAAALLPAYLGPGLPRVDVLPWPAQRALLTGEDKDVVDGLVREVDDLVLLDDASLVATLRGLGSAVVPGDARAWVSRLAWRARRFRWDA